MLRGSRAIAQVYSFNTIATLVYHTGYYVSAMLEVLKGNPLDAHDQFSFAHPPITSQANWDSMLNKIWANSEEFATCIAQLPERKLMENMAKKKYGSYYRNIHGIIEHTHYHLGQIVIIKKLLHEGA